MEVLAGALIRGSGVEMAMLWVRVKWGLLFRQVLVKAWEWLRG